MKINTKREVDNAIRDLRNVVRDLMNADYLTYESNVKRLIYLVNSNEILFNALNSYISKTLDLSKIEVNLDGGWGKLVLPLSKEERISYGLQVLKRFSESDGYAIEYAFSFFYNKNITAALRKINEQLFTPIFRDIFQLLEEINKETKIANESEQINSKTIIQIGTLSANGSVAVGKDIYQNITIQNGINEQIVMSLLQNSIPLSEVDKIRTQIEQLADELLKPKPEQSVIVKAFKGMIDFGQKLAVPIIANTVNRPEVHAALASLL